MDDDQNPTPSHKPAASPAKHGGSLQGDGRDTVLALVTLVLVIAVLVVVVRRDDGSSSAAPGGAAALSAAIKTDRYQAVYLDNERVYFGKLRAVKGDWFELRDAFFIRQTEGKDGKPGTNEVVRITEEPAEPQEDLLIEAGSIDMVENLKASSSVAEAIDDVVE